VASEKLLTRVCLCHQANLVPAKERLRSAVEKVTVYQVSHWPCVTDLVVYPFGLSGLSEGDEHPAYAHNGCDIL